MEIRKTKPEELNILIRMHVYLWQVTETLCNGGTPILHHRS